MQFAMAPPQEMPTLGLQISLYILIIVATIEFAFSASTLSWFHSIKGDHVGFIIIQHSNSSSSHQHSQRAIAERATKHAYILLATPEKLVLTPLRATAAAAFIACLVIGVYGIYILRLRSQVLLAPLHVDPDSSSNNNDANGNDPNEMASVPYPSGSPPPTALSNTSTNSARPPETAKTRMNRIQVEAYNRLPPPLRHFVPHPRSFTVIHATHNTVLPNQPSNLAAPPAAGAAGAGTASNPGNPETNAGDANNTEANANSNLLRPNHPANHYYATNGGNQSQRDKRHRRHRLYYRLWIFFHLPAIILTLGVVAYSMPAMRAPQGVIDVNLVIKNGDTARYASPPPPPPPPPQPSGGSSFSAAPKPAGPPPGVWTPKGWLEAVMRLGHDLVGMGERDDSTFTVSRRSGDVQVERRADKDEDKKMDDDDDDDDDRWRVTMKTVELKEQMAGRMKMLGGWELLLTALAVAQGIETITAFWEAVRWRRQERLMKGEYAGVPGAPGTGEVRGYSF